MVRLTAAPQHLQPVIFQARKRASFLCALCVRARRFLNATSSGFFDYEPHSLRVWPVEPGCARPPPFQRPPRVLATRSQACLIPLMCPLHTRADFSTRRRPTFPTTSHTLYFSMVCQSRLRSPASFPAPTPPASLAARVLLLRARRLVAGAWPHAWCFEVLATTSVRSALIAGIFWYVPSRASRPCTLSSPSG
jgi:hypothetical protein